MEKQYWVIRGVKAVGYNAHGGSYVVGVPQLTAISGWVHALLRKVCEIEKAAFNFDSKFVYAVEHYGGVSGIALNPRSEKGTVPGKKGTPAAIVDKPKATAIISIVIEVSGARLPAYSQSAVLRAVEGSRLMGSSLFFEYERGNSVFCESSLESALGRFGRTSFVVADASRDVLSEIEKGEAEGKSIGTVEAMSNLFARPRDGTYKPRFVPMVVGYQSLNSEAFCGADLNVLGAPARGASNGAELAHKAGLEEISSSNESIEQVNWCEPMLGACRFQSKASARKEIRGQSQGAFAGLWSCVATADSWRVEVGARPSSEEADEEYLPI